MLIKQILPCSELDRYLCCCLTHLDVAVGTSDDVNALPVLFVFKDAGIVLGCENEQQVFALTLSKKKKKVIKD